LSPTTTADALAQVASDPDTIERHFPAAARTAAREGIDGDAAREALLLALPGDTAYVVELVSRVYEHGDPAERRAVLLALPALDAPDRTARIGDAALGPYAATQLDDDAWRQAVLKVIFMGIPVSQVSGLDRRSDAELARMVRDFAAEREAAGRVVPPDALAILALVDTPAPSPSRAD